MMTSPTVTTRHPWMVGLGGLVAALTIVLANVASEAQSFSSGSDGSDDALTVAANSGTIVFDPRDTTRWGRVLDPDGDGVYNFTTIIIGSGSTLRLGADKVNRPVYWLASGDVVISGTIDLKGENGPQVAYTDLLGRRKVAVPGSGGYAGGAGGRIDPAIPATPGEGPGGGFGLNQNPNCGGIPTNFCGNGGTFTGNRFLVPLVGGSGAAGGVYPQFPIFYGGGAGGGAILLASSASIAVDGQINAAGGGGSNGVGGGGSGGAIRLVAPTISGTGTLTVTGGGSVSSGGSGWVRLEGFQISNSLQLDAARLMTGSPIDSTSLTPPSSIRVIAIDGVSVPANASGSFVLADVTISNNSPVNVEIQATGIPPGTVVTLQIYPQSPIDMTTVNLPTAQATLVGTVESSTATATFTFPYGFSRGFVRASWTQ